MPPMMMECERRDCVILLPSLKSPPPSTQNFRNNDPVPVKASLAQEGEDPRAGTIRRAKCEATRRAGW